MLQFKAVYRLPYNHNRRNFSLLALLFIITLIFSACSNGTTDSKVVAEKYRFIGEWYNQNIGDTDGDFELNKNTLTVTNSSGDFEYNNVYTKESGSISNWGNDNTFAYLYSGNIKIGIVVIDSAGIRLEMGKTFLNNQNWSGVDTNGMQNKHNGSADLDF